MLPQLLLGNSVLYFHYSYSHYSEFTPPVLIEETTTAPIAATTTTTEPMTTTTIEEIIEVTTEYPSGEGPVPIPAEEFDNCKDFINNCAEFNGNQFRICDVTPEESLFQTYKVIKLFILILKFLLDNPGILQKDLRPLRHQRQLRKPRRLL